MMNFSKKSFGHPFDHLGHFHGPRHFSWPTLTVPEMNHFKTYVKQTLGSFGAALGVYLLLTQPYAGSNALAALAGVSALLYLGFLIESSSPAKMLLNLLAVPLIFTLAYASLTGPGTFLVAAFVLQALVAAIQMAGQEKGRKAQLYSWASFNTCLALLL